MKKVILSFFVFCIFLSFNSTASDWHTLFINRTGKNITFTFTGKHCMSDPGPKKIDVLSDDTKKVHYKDSNHSGSCTDKEKSVSYDMSLTDTQEKIGTLKLVHYKSFGNKNFGRWVSYAQITMNLKGYILDAGCGRVGSDDEMNCTNQHQPSDFVRTIFFKTKI